MTANRYRPSLHRDDRSRTGVHSRREGHRRVVHVARASSQFWIMAAMLGLAAMLGGSSRPDVATVHLLRPLSIFFLAYSFFGITLHDIRAYRWLLILVVGLVGLHLSHVIVLPASLWSALPGRDIIVRVDQFLGLQVWRPLSMDPEGSWNALYALALPIAALLLGMQLNKTDHVRLVFLIVLLIGISGLLGVLQSAGGDIHLYPRSVGATGLFANRNHQAALLAIFLPLMAVAASTSEKLWPKIRHARVASWVVGAVAIPLILVTGSRAGLLLGIVAVTSILAARLYQGTVFQASTGRFSRLRSPLVLGVGALLAAGVLAWLTIVQARGEALDRLQSGNFELRWPIWQGAWELGRKFWPVGSGVGSYERVYQIYEPAELLRPTYSNHVHNDWLEVVMTAGLPGVLLLVCGIALYILALSRGFRGMDTGALLRRGGLVTVLLLALASVVDYPIRVPFVACVFALGWVWCFVGLGDNAN